MARHAVLALVALLAATSLLACRGSSGPSLSSDSSQPIRGTVTVFAASSLTDAFKEIASRFEETYPGTHVRFNFAGSPTLRTQLEQGARADIFASADFSQMDLAVKSNVVNSSVRLFARNSLAIVTPAGNPGKVGSPLDLARPGLKLLLANRDVPVGAYSFQVLDKLEADPAHGSGFARRVLSNTVSLESNVKQVVAKVQLGEADAGIVYRSDVTRGVGAALNVIEIPEPFNVTADYPIALLKEARNPRAAAAFIEFVISPAGQAILMEHGFESVGT